MPRINSKYSREEIDAMILEAIKDKTPLAELSRKVGVSHASIYNYAKALGVYTGADALTKEQEELVLKMESENATMGEMAKAVGKTYAAMQSWLQYRGYRLPKKHYVKACDNNPLTEEEIDENNLIMAERKPKAYEYTHNGKTWQDVTEFFTGV